MSLATVQVARLHLRFLARSEARGAEQSHLAALVRDALALNAEGREGQRIETAGWDGVGASLAAAIAAIGQTPQGSVDLGEAAVQHGDESVLAFEIPGRHAIRVYDDVMLGDGIDASDPRFAFLEEAGLDVLVLRTQFALWLKYRYHISLTFTSPRGLRSIWRSPHRARNMPRFLWIAGLARLRFEEYRLMMDQDAVFILNQEGRNA